MDTEENKHFKRDSVISCLAIIVAVLVGIMYLSYAKQIKDNQAQITALKGEINNLRNELNSVYENVDEQMKEQASLFTKVDYSVGDISQDQKSIKSIFSVVPKEITTDMKLFVTVEEKTAELKRDGNEFKGTIDVGMFVKADNYPLVTVETSSGTKTEYLESVYVSDMFQSYLPTIIFDYEGESTCYDGSVKINYDFTICHGENDSDVTFVSYALVEEIEDKEINREDITDKVKQAENNYVMNYDRTFTGLKGEVYIEAVDSWGYTHKIPAYSWWYEDGQIVDATAVFEESIYDKDGNLLYGAEL